MMNTTVACLLCLCFVTATKPISALKCNVRVNIDSGWVCGALREAALGVEYASFRGIPYAQQPLGKLRFKELQPVAPWSQDFDATEEGPVCPQEDVLYGNLVKPDREMSEACIHVNVHVPVHALPKSASSKEPQENSADYPIFIFIHGGGFSYGSGDADLHGPEYLVNKGFIVITFNYRLNVFGFLSLNSTEIPGNAGLRDQLTLLHWVQRNAQAFGGDPHDITLAGQSAGAVSAHLLALSNQTKGLFRRLILMSGTGVPAFYTPSPVYASDVAKKFLKTVGINSMDPEVIHNQLTEMPIEKIMEANSKVLHEVASGTASFMPVVEAKHPGVTMIVDDDPVHLIHSGRDKQYPIIVGLTDNECASLRQRFKDVDLINRIQKNPSMILDTRILNSVDSDDARFIGNIVINNYFHGKINMDDFLTPCSDTLIKYPALQLARWRDEMNAAPTYLYQFTYKSDHSVLKDVLNIQYEGNAHIEDVLYLFRKNTALVGDFCVTKSGDDKMSDWMTTLIVNFVQCDDPSCGDGWPPVNHHKLNYQSLYRPGVYNNTYPTPDEWKMIHFFDKIHRIVRRLLSDWPGGFYDSQVYDGTPYYCECLYYKQGNGGHIYYMTEQSYN